MRVRILLSLTSCLLFLPFASAQDPWGIAITKMIVPDPPTTYGQGVDVGCEWMDQSGRASSQPWTMEISMSGQETWDGGVSYEGWRENERGAALRNIGVNEPGSHTFSCRAVDAAGAVRHTTNVMVEIVARPRPPPPTSSDPSPSTPPSEPSQNGTMPLGSPIDESTGREDLSTDERGWATVERVSWVVGILAGVLGVISAFFVWERMRIGRKPPP